LDLVVVRFTSRLQLGWLLWKSDVFR